MAELEMLIVFILSIIVLVTYFNIANRLKVIKNETVQLRKSLDRHDSAFWVNEYKVSKFRGNNKEGLMALRNLIYYEVKKASDENKKAVFNMLEERYTDKFKDSGEEFPAWDDDIFN